MAVSTFRLLSWVSSASSAWVFSDGSGRDQVPRRGLGQAIDHIPLWSTHGGLVSNSVTEKMIILLNVYEGL